MPPPEQAEYLAIVHKLAALRDSGMTTGKALLETLSDTELEAMLRDFLKTPASL